MQEVLGRLPLTFAPFVENWLEETLVELGHASESCSTEEEIKLL